jgi:hypothetical protein
MRCYKMLYYTNNEIFRTIFGVSSLDYHDWQITSHPFRRKADMEKAQNR